MCLAIVCVVALLPLLAVNSHAEETSSSTETTPTAITEPIPPYIPPYPSSGEYVPNFRVITTAGSFSTASRVGQVYAYFTSNNNPKASTRTAFSTSLADGTSAPTTRVFVFQNHSVSPSVPNVFRIEFPTFDIIYPNVLESNDYNPILNSAIRFSENVTLTVELTFTALNPGAPSSRTFEFLYYLEYNQYITFLDLINYLGDTPESSPSFQLSDYAISYVTISFSSRGFDGSSPDTSYCDIVSKPYSTSTYLEYVTSVSNYVNRTDDLLSYEYLLGQYEGYPLAYDHGFSDGFLDGQEKSLNPGWFVRGVDAFLNVRLFQFAVGEKLVDFTLGTILSITLGGTALIWFLKLFAGG